MFNIWNSWITLIFHKQPVYKQQALKWQIAKKLSGIKPLSLSNNKKYRWRKGVFFLCIIAVKPTIYQNLAVSKALLGKF